MEEIFDLYDKYRNKTGNTVKRSEAKNVSDAYHIVASIIIFNSENKMLIQQRQSSKTNPNLWDLTAKGAVSSGETSMEAAERELFEELGIKHDFSNERPVLTAHGEIAFYDHFIIIKDIEISELNLQAEEVQNAKWATMEEIFELIDTKEFVQHRKSFIQYIFEIKNSRKFTIKLN